MLYYFYLFSFFIRDKYPYSLFLISCLFLNKVDSILPL